MLTIAVALHIQSRQYLLQEFKVNKGNIKKLKIRSLFKIEETYSHVRTPMVQLLESKSTQDTARGCCENLMPFNLNAPHRTPVNPVRVVIGRVHWTVT